MENCCRFVQLPKFLIKDFDYDRIADVTDMLNNLGCDSLELRRKRDVTRPGTTPMLYFKKVRQI